MSEKQTSTGAGANERPLVAIQVPTTASEKPSIVADAGSDGTPYAFVPRATLTINSLGISWFRFPRSVKELTIPILRDSTPAYQSVRFKRSSGSCVLTSLHPTATEVARTQYTFGPGKKRAPVVTIAGEELRIFKACVSHRKYTFQWRGERYEWIYEKEERPATASSEGGVLKTKLLVLYVGEGETRRKVAELVRNRETRTTGSGSTWAGNGGALVLGEGVEEVVVVATVLVMLKKEVDRRILQQIVLIY